MNATIAGSFASYNFPSTIPPFSRCHWVIQAEKGSFVRLHFSDFRVECIDSVHLLENETNDWTQTNKLGLELSKIEGGICGKAPPLYISETSKLVVVYSTQLDATSMGFKVNYNMQGELVYCIYSIYSIINNKKKLV